MALDGFGNRLRVIRQERGYTQKQLAHLLGVTEQAVSKYERGGSYPDIVMLDGISNVLDCSLDYLFQYESGKKNLLHQDSIERRAEINRILLPDIISLQFGEKLIPLFIEESKQGFPHINELRRQMARHWGVTIPIIRLMDQLALAENEYQICIYGICVYKDAIENIDKNELLIILEKLKEMIFQNIDKVLNNQSIYFMVENLREKYPYVVESIVPEAISYSKLRQVLIYLIKDYGITASPLILIIEAIEKYRDIENIEELVKKTAMELGEEFRFENWAEGR